MIKISRARCHHNKYDRARTGKSFYLAFSIDYKLQRTYSNSFVYTCKKDYKDNIKNEEKFLIFDIEKDANDFVLNYFIKNLFYNKKFIPE